MIGLAKRGNSCSMDHETMPSHAGFAGTPGGPHQKERVVRAVDGEKNARREARPRFHVNKHLAISHY